MKIYKLLILGIISAGLIEGKMNEKITIVPVGKIDKIVISYLRKNLNEKFQVTITKKWGEIEIASPMEEPSYAFNSARNQYYSTSIVKKISSTIKDNGKVLGITDVDLYCEGLNFVFGEAEGIGGRVAVISLKRLRQEFYKLKPNEKLFMERALKEAVHEIGHLYGLMHCNNEKCVMHFSNCLLDTDIKNSSFCPGCQQRIK